MILFVVGCGSSRLRTSDAPASSDAAVGVAVDPASELPRPTDLAKEGEAVATLRAPLPPDVVAGIVHRLFEAFHARASTSMEVDLDDTIVDIRIDGDPGKARYYWLGEFNQRLKGLPFDQLEIEQMYRSQDVEVYAREDLGQPGRPARPWQMAADDVLVRIPIATPRLGADVLFGDEIKLLLRRDGNGYKIHGYFEIVPR